MKPIDVCFGMIKVGIVFVIAIALLGFAGPTVVAMGEYLIGPRQLACSDMRHRAVPHDFAVFILIEAKVDEAANEVSGLRVAAAHRQVNLFRERVWLTGIVLDSVAQKRSQIASGGISDPQY